MKGMNWEPAPSTYKSLPAPGEFGDTDFGNDDFVALWDVDANGIGRRDLQTIKDLGCNTIKTYNWSVPAPNGYWGRDHKKFLAKVKALGLCVIVPISAFFTGTAYNNRTDGKNAGSTPPDAALPDFIEQIVAEIYSGGDPAPAVLWAIGNEFDNNNLGAYGYCEAQDIAAIAAYIVAAEKKLNIDPARALAFTSPLTTALRPVNRSIPVDGRYDKVMAGYAIQALIDAFEKAVGKQATSERFIAAVNSYQTGAQLTDYYDLFATTFPNLKFFYGELGRDAQQSTATQAQTIHNQFSITMEEAKPASHFYGSCLFEFSDELWKAPPGHSEAMFGIYTFAPGQKPKTSQQTGHAPMWNAAYPVDALEARPAAAYLKAALSGQPPPTGVA